MQDNEFSRFDDLIGEEERKFLQKRHVAIFGLGGVGSFAAEAIARSFVGKISLFDSDVVQKSNINRQICALHSTIGLSKVDVIAKRIRDINPDCHVYENQIFFCEKNRSKVDFQQFDFVIDAIDSVKEKILLIAAAKKNNVEIASAMGTAAKMHPEMLEISDIYNTSCCPLAKVVRTELRKLNIDALDVVYSRETPAAKTHDFLPSSPFVPSAAGIMLASIAVRRLLKSAERVSACD